MNDPVIVHSWPADAGLVLDDLRSDRAFAVISVAAPNTTIRHVARERIGMALRETLGAFLQRPPASVPLVSQPGKPPVVDLPDRRIGLSVSHEAGLSIAALHLRGAIGIDLMRVEHGSNWMPGWKRVAQDYLGQRSYERIAELPAEHRAPAFAQEWTRLEACLKYLGAELTEWSPALERRLDSCRVRLLDLHERLSGAIATGCVARSTSAADD